MSKQSYMTGFCKAASAAGVDPQALAQYVMSKKAETVNELLDKTIHDEFDKLKPDPTEDEPSETDYAVADYLLYNAERDGVVSPFKISGTNTVGDVLRSRERVLNPTPMEQVAIANANPFIRDGYTAATNSYDVATAPFVGMNPTNEIPDVVGAQMRIKGFRNFLNHPAFRKHLVERVKK